MTLHASLHQAVFLCVIQYIGLFCGLECSAVGIGSGFGVFKFWIGDVEFGGWCVVGLMWWFVVWE